MMEKYGKRRKRNTKPGPSLDDPGVFVTALLRCHSCLVQVRSSTCSKPSVVVTTEAVHSVLPISLEAINTLKVLSSMIKLRALSFVCK